MDPLATQVLGKALALAIKDGFENALGVVPKPSQYPFNMNREQWRNELACKAMAGLLPLSQYTPPLEPGAIRTPMINSVDPGKIAELSFICADEMLAEYDKRR